MGGEADQKESRDGGAKAAGSQEVPTGGTAAAGDCSGPSWDASAAETVAAMGVDAPAAPLQVDSAARPPASPAVIWFVRLAFATVFCWNVLCAVQFVADPAAYMGAYQLSGIQGEVALRGLGVAFLMWNATYPLFILNPRRYRVLGGVILAQQVIGLVGELLIFCTLPEGYSILAGSILRFAAFDAAGLALMAITLPLKV